MASKTAEQTEAPEAAPEVVQDSPLLDMSDAAVKKMIKAAKARGFVTYDELNKVLPSEEFSSEQIEDTLSMLSEMGITVIENEEAEDAAERAEVETELGLELPEPEEKGGEGEESRVERADDGG